MRRLMIHFFFCYHHSSAFHVKNQVTCDLNRVNNGALKITRIERADKKRTKSWTNISFSLFFYHFLTLHLKLNDLYLLQFRIHTRLCMHKDCLVLCLWTWVKRLDGTAWERDGDIFIKKKKNEENEGNRKWYYVHVRGIFAYIPFKKRKKKKICIYLVFSLDGSNSLFLLFLCCWAFVAIIVVGCVTKSVMFVLLHILHTERISDYVNCKLWFHRTKRCMKRRTTTIHRTEKKYVEKKKEWKCLNYLEWMRLGFVKGNRLMCFGACALIYPFEICSINESDLKNACINWRNSI